MFITAIFINFDNIVIINIVIINKISIIIIIVLVIIIISPQGNLYTDTVIIGE